VRACGQHKVKRKETDSSTQKTKQQREENRPSVSKSRVRHSVAAKVTWAIQGPKYRTKVWRPVPEEKRKKIRRNE
jgi:hypothetical protein